MKHNKKPTVLILTSSFPRSNSDETCGYIREFATSLCRDYSVTVLAPPDREADDRGYDDVTVLRSWSPVPWRLERFAGTSDFNNIASGPVLTNVVFLVSASFYVLRAIGLARRASLICCHWIIPSGLIGLLCSMALRRPFVVVEHSGALHLLKRSRAGACIARIIVSGSEKVYVVSSDLKQKIEMIAPKAADKIEVISMGVDCASYSTVRACSQALAASPVVDGIGRGFAKFECAGPAYRGSVPSLLRVLFIGRLTPIKGADVLIRAAATLPGIAVTVAGDGESGASLKALAEALRVPVTFMGAVDRSTKMRLMEDCDAVVVPSVLMAGGRCEGLPVICLEAMAAGKAVVASRCGGLTDVISDGDNGLLFEPGDHEMLTSKLRQLQEDPWLRRQLGVRAAVTASRYDWNVIGERFRRSIGELL